MADEQQVGEGRLNARLRGVSPAVTRRIHIAEQALLGKLHAALQVAFGRRDHAAAVTLGHSAA